MFVSMLAIYCIDNVMNCIKLLSINVIFENKKGNKNIKSSRINLPVSEMLVLLRQANAQKLFI